MTRLVLSASLVVYRPELGTLKRTLLALQEAGRTAKAQDELKLQLTLVDNSSDPVVHQELSQWLEQLLPELSDWRVDLLLSSGNLGYGRGNNMVIDKVNSDYHMVVNPDLFVAPDSLVHALRFLETNADTGLLTPAVFGEQGERHYLCKRHPTLLIMYLRSFSPRWLQSLFGAALAEFEMRDCDYEKPIFDVEYPTGSCMFFRTRVLKEIGGFDPDYFLHYEDADIGRRASVVARVVYVPDVKVVHQWARDTHRSWKASLLTVKSGLIYWRKWNGWFGRSRIDADQKISRILKHASAAPATVASRQPGEGQMVLVTGANGFIGKAVCSDLPARGYRVLGTVRQKLSLTAESGREQVVMDEIDSNSDWSGALAGVDSVVHLAARVHLMRETAADPLTEFRRTNVALTLNLARQAARAGVRRFVFISSIKVNGEVTPVGQPYTASDVPQPTDPYGISKYEAEIGLKAIAAETGLEVVIIRPVLVYGPNVKANFSSMMNWLLKGVPLPLGSLRNKRSFVALDNLVDLIAVCIQHPAAVNQTFLVSDGDDLTISELLRRTGVALNRPARLIPLPVVILRAGAKLLHQEAVMQRLLDSLQVDITKTRCVLGWTPPVRVDEALKETAQHFLRGDG